MNPRRPARLNARRDPVTRDHPFRISTSDLGRVARRARSVASASNGGSSTSSRFASYTASYATLVSAVGTFLTSREVLAGLPESHAFIERVNVTIARNLNEMRDVLGRRVNNDEEDNPRLSGPQILELDRAESRLQRVMQRYHTQLQMDREQNEADRSQASRENTKLLVTDKISQQQVNEELQCAICVKDFTEAEEVKRLSCNHFFHEQCILRWLQEKTTCPLCREICRTQH